MSVLQLLTTAPSSGQVLTATNSTTATWQNPAPISINVITSASVSYYNLTNGTATFSGGVNQAFDGRYISGVYILHLSIQVSSNMTQL